MSQTSHERGQISLALASAAALALLLPALLPALLLGAISAILPEQADACTAQPAPTGQARHSIPPAYLALYRQAGQGYGIPWEVLAGIGEVESDHGQSNAPGVHSGANVAGAAGPMQFGIRGAAGNTWGGAAIHPAFEHTGGYGIDGDHDGIVNVYDPGDAIPSAARFLLAHGAPSDMRATLYAYNHSPDYVSLVLRWAASYARGGTQLLAATTSPACAPAAVGPLPPGVAGKIIAYAEAQLGKPYLWGGTGPDAFDCSGLAMMAYRAAGIAIPRTSQQQWAAGSRVPPRHEQPGDLVFFAGSDGTPQAPGHVGIVIGNGEMIEAYATGFPIRVATYGRPSSPPGDQVAVGFTRPVVGS